MKNLSSKIALFLLVFFNLSCEEPNNELEKSYHVGFVDLNEYGVINISSNNNLRLSSDDFETIQIEIEFINGIINIYTAKNFDEYVKIDNALDSKEIYFDKTNENVTFKVNDNIVSIDSVNFSDLLVGTYLLGGGDLGSVSAPIIATECFHTAISVRSRKTISEANAQGLIDAFLEENPSCSQVGGIDSYCIFGDFGCVSAGEIECPDSHSSCE